MAQGGGGLRPPVSRHPNPSAAARATRAGRTGFIGMIRSPSMALSVHEPHFDMGLDEALHDRGYCLLRDILDEPVADEAGVAAQPPRIVREHAIDGLIINYAFGTPAPVRRLLDRSELPTVWVNRKRDFNCVHPDDEGAAYEATCSLLGCGHRRVVFLDCPQSFGTRMLEPHYSIADRIAGYSRAMAAAGLDPVVEQLPGMRYGVYHPGYLMEQCMGLLRKPGRPTAFICGGSLGRTLISAAIAVGLKVPNDISVMTFDNDAMADHHMACDRVLVRYRAMGHAVVEMLCKLVEEPTRTLDPIVIPFEFHRTGTVARPSIL